MMGFYRLRTSVKMQQSEHRVINEFRASCVLEQDIDQFAAVGGTNSIEVLVPLTRCRSRSSSLTLRMASWP